VNRCKAIDAKHVRAPGLEISEGRNLLVTGYFLQRYQGFLHTAHSLVKLLPWGPPEPWARRMPGQGGVLGFALPNCLAFPSCPNTARFYPWYSLPRRLTAAASVSSTLGIRDHKAFTSTKVRRDGATCTQQAHDNSDGTTTVQTQVSELSKHEHFYYSGQFISGTYFSSHGFDVYQPFHLSLQSMSAKMRKPKGP